MRRANNVLDEHRVGEAIMQPALQAILAACGFAVEIIPEDQDDAGCILVTGHTGAPA